MLPDGRRGGVAGLLNSGNLILFCGGLDFQDKERSECWTLEYNEKSWKTANPLLQPVAFAASGTVNDSFYVIGGWHENKAVNTLQVFSQGKWKLGPGLSTPRYGSCSVAYLDYLVVVGGWKSLRAKEALETQKTIEVFSIARQKWKTLKTPETFAGQSTGSCVPDNGGMILVGGITYTNDDGSFQSQINDGANILTFGKKNGGIEGHIRDGVAVSWHAGFGWIGDWLFLAGGRGVTGEKEKGIFRWKEGRTWEQFSNLPVPRDQSASLTLSSIWSNFASYCTE